MPVWFGWKERLLRTPAWVLGELLKRRVVGCDREHDCKAQEVRRVVRGVGVWGSSSRRCTGVRGRMVGVCVACDVEKQWYRCFVVEQMFECLCTGLLFGDDCRKNEYKTKTRYSTTSCLTSSYVD